MLDSQVRYEGEDEEKGKQQGQALFKRQKLFFNLVRAAKKVGFNSRRGLQVDSEKLTLKTLTAMGRCGEDVSVVDSAPSPFSLPVVIFCTSGR